MRANGKWRVRREGLRAAAESRRGFTLLEVMVVIIIGTIAGLVGVNVLNRLEESKIRAAKIQLSTFRDALDMFKMDNNFYPDSAQGLNALVQPPAVGRNPAGFRPGGYLRDPQVPLDPWGMPYLYLCDDGFLFQVWSGGPDSKPGTEDDIFP
jgi:general secretion pathway protein G